VKSYVKQQIGQLHINVLNGIDRKYEMSLSQGLATGQTFAKINDFIKDSILDSALATTQAIFSLASNRNIYLDENDMTSIKGIITSSYIASIHHLFDYFKSNDRYSKITNRLGQGIGINKSVYAIRVRNDINWYIDNEINISELAGPTAEQIANKLNFAIVLISLISLAASVVSLCC